MLVLWPVFQRRAKVFLDKTRLFVYIYIYSYRLRGKTPHVSVVGSAVLPWKIRFLGIVGLVPPFCSLKNSKYLKSEKRAFMKHLNVRSRLIDCAIKTIAEKGMDKTTTKAIVNGTDINEAYIYSYFNGKEDLLIKTFETLDLELVNKLLQHLPIMDMTNLDYETRCRAYFLAVWEFLLGNREKCLAFVRYYYSPYFIQHSVDAHKLRYQPIVDQFATAFISEANVWMILNHILNVMLDFSVKVHNNQMPNDDSYAEHVFRVVYRSIEQYFIKGEEKK